MTSRAQLMGSEDYGFGWCSPVGKSESPWSSPGDRPTPDRGKVCYNHYHTGNCQMTESGR